MKENKRMQEMGQGKPNDRENFFGLLALLSLALPAIAIRVLLPELNPLLLAAIGIAVYGAYLTWFLRMHVAHLDAEQASLKAVEATARHHSPLSEEDTYHE